MKRIIPIIAALLLAACTTTYTHPIKGPDQFDRDHYRCQQEARQAAANFGAGGNPIIIASETRECLERLYGWEAA